MKQKWIKLTWPQRVVILVQAFLVLLFLILYLTVGRQQIMKYHDGYLRCHTDGDTVTYTGKIDGEKAVFTVSPGPVVEYRLGDTCYGPYTIVFDSTAVPDAEDLPRNITSAADLVGVEVWNGETRLFRGAYQDTETFGFYLLDTQGTVISGDEMEFGLISATSGFAEVYGYTHRDEPGAFSILKLAVGSGIERRSSLGPFWAGVFLCVLCAWSVLYADALFRWKLHFRIRRTEDAEPSDWEIFSRWVGWIGITIIALVWFITNLN